MESSPRMKTWLKDKIRGFLSGVDFDVLVPPDPEMGDYSTNAAFVLATRNRGNTEGAESAEEIAQKIVEELKQDKDLVGVFEKIEAVKP
ncbi:MAG: hypothetical protein HYZ69_03135, partial [Candidatus Colwellbacteria bacterium]|nr:hypothetical protein [Candidatus Colwellbacteria bacterium]